MEKMKKTPENNAKIYRDRKGNFLRKTTETYIKFSLNLDGKGIYKIDSGVPFFNHMLEQFSKHSRFDITLEAKGDTDIDLHHLVEDIGIVMGGALRELSGDKKGIQRFGSAFVPMDESMVHSVVDFSGRSFFIYKYDGTDMTEPIKPTEYSRVLSRLSDKYKEFDKDGIREILVDKFFYVYSNIFFEALCKNALINLHINVLYGSNAHHMVEAVFKATGISVSNALEVKNNRNTVPSTKGSI